MTTDDLFAFKTVLYVLSDDALKVMLTYDAGSDWRGIILTEMFRRGIDEGVIRG